MLPMYTENTIHIKKAIDSALQNRAPAAEPFRGGREGGPCCAFRTKG